MCRVLVVKFTVELGGLANERWDAVQNQRFIQQAKAQSVAAMFKQNLLTDAMSADAAVKDESSQAASKQCAMCFKRSEELKVLADATQTLQKETDGALERTQSTAQESSASSPQLNDGSQVPRSGDNVEAVSQEGTLCSAHQACIARLVRSWQIRS